MKVILGKKISMTQKFSEKGVTPVTIVHAGPCTVTQVKGAKEGYQAIQISFEKTAKKLSKAVLGHLKGLGGFKILREFRFNGDAQRGQTISVSVFQPGDIVQVTGISKGKGFQGVVKRHHFHGSPASHGHKDQQRMPGSIGSTEPKHVFKGTRMAGRMGDAQVTVKNLEIIEVDAEENLLYIKGAVPGGRNSILAISGEGEMQFVDPTAPVAEPAPVAVEEAAPAAEPVVEAPAEAVPAPEAQPEATKE